MNDANMASRALFARTAVISQVLCIVWLSFGNLLLAGAADGQIISHATAPYVATAKNLGVVDPAETIEVTIWLKLHNRGELDTWAKDLYDPSSSRYRHWLTRSDIAQQFAPTEREARVVQDFFESNNLNVIKVGGNNFFVRARGTVENVEQAFHVQLNNYLVHGKVIRSNANDPYVEGEAGAFVRTVSGLDAGEYEHPVIVRPIRPLKGKFDATTVIPATDPAFYSPNCFDVETQRFSTNNDGELPVATYRGSHINLPTFTSAGCGYTPAEIQAAYKLTGPYAEGYKGTGQTIVIIDWCGSSTIRDDANAFSKRFGLPLLNSSNFEIIYTPAPSSCIGEDMVEINLDVEWAHAIAPEAHIDLVVPPSSKIQDVDEAEFFAVNYGLGNSLSGSYGSPENLTPASVLETESLISEMAAVSGISTNFSSGDYGDYSSVEAGTTVSAPADSPWATGVGGVTLALNPDGSIAWQAGWGNNETLLAQQGQISDPPAPQQFDFGSGGGRSNCALQDKNGNCLDGFPKPSFQKAVPGANRQVPDIAWLADPFTGAVIAISIPGQSPELVWEVVGGTSLACPMFSGLWAIANQEAGIPLGQAAQYLYSMPSGAITDIVPVTSRHNLTASIKEPASINIYTAKETVGGVPPVYMPATFVSALWDDDYDTALTLSFGTDCSILAPDSGFGTPCSDPSALHTKTGWDNVTGIGTPNGQAFLGFFGADKRTTDDSSTSPSQ